MLSQEEIDQLVKELCEVNVITSSGVSDGLIGGLNIITPNKETTCDHNWKEYTGLFHTDVYCTKCNEIKK